MNNINSNDRPIVEAVLESGEVATDFLMHGDILTDIPFIGTALKICKAVDSIRDRAFALKLSRFVMSLENITEKQKRSLKEKMSAGGEEAKKIGEILLFVLERVTDLNKPSLLSQVFLAYIDGVVSGEELRRLCQAVDTAFADDLQHFLAADIIHERSDKLWMQYLVSSGLTRQVGAKAIGDINGQLYFEMAPLGQKLRDAYFHAKASSKN